MPQVLITIASTIVDKSQKGVYQTSHEDLSSAKTGARRMLYLEQEPFWCRQENNIGLYAGTPF